MKRIENLCEILNKLNEDIGQFKDSIVNIKGQCLTLTNNFVSSLNIDLLGTEIKRKTLKNNIKMTVKNTFKPCVESLDVALGVGVEGERLVGLQEKIRCLQKACLQLNFVVFPDVFLNKNTKYNLILEARRRKVT